jgi:hypothetical protein
MRLTSRLLVCLVAAAALAAGSARADSQPQILLIGDSVATGMQWHNDAIAALQKGLDVDWEVAICRTTAGISCPSDGVRPPTLVELVQTMKSVPPVVVVVLGYNDEADTFPASIDEAMSALLAAGAQHVLWLTLHAARPPYPALNQMLLQATARWPQLELVDWDKAAAGNYSWFQNDGVHLVDAGGLAMAHLVHAAVMQIVDPLRVVGTLPHLRAGHAYTLHLHAAGGASPYRWSVSHGRPPLGFHLRANGSVVASPVRGPHTTFTVVVTDADGARATLPVAAR